MSDDCLSTVIKVSLFLAIPPAIITIFISISSVSNQRDEYRQIVEKSKTQKLTDEEIKKLPSRYGWTKEVLKNYNNQENK